MQRRIRHIRLSYMQPEDCTLKHILAFIFAVIIAVICVAAFADDTRVARQSISTSDPVFIGDLVMVDDKIIVDHSPVSDPVKMGDGPRTEKTNTMQSWGLYFGATFFIAILLYFLFDFVFRPIVIAVDRNGDPTMLYGMAARQAIRDAADDTRRREKMKAERKRRYSSK
jgi:hypothetical protein